MNATAIERVIIEFFERRRISVAKDKGEPTLAVAGTIQLTRGEDTWIEQDMPAEFFAVADLAQAIARGDGT